MRVTAESADQQNKDRGNKRANHWNEFQQARERGEEQRVRNSHQAKNNAERRHGGQAQDHQCTHVSDQQQIDIFGNIFDQVAPRSVLKKIQNLLTHHAPVFEEKEAQYGHDDNQDQIAGDRESLDSHFG